MKQHQNSQNITPVPDSEKDKFAREFDDKLGEIIRDIARWGQWGKKSLPPDMIEPDDFFTRVWRYADRSRRNNKEFREFWRTPELKVETIRSHYLWPCWIQCANADLWDEFYGFMPRIISWDQTRFLRIAVARHKRGCAFFPLAQDQMPEEEKRLLNQLLKNKNAKIVEVPDASGVGIFRVDAEYGPLALRITHKKRGGGFRRLKKLVHMGFLREVPTDDLALLCYFDETGAKLTLEVTETGINYLEKFKNGSLFSYLDSEGKNENGKEKDLEGSVLLLDEGAAEIFNEKSKEKPFNDPAFLRYCESKGFFLEKYAGAYILMTFGDPKEGRKLTSDEVSMRTGINAKTLGNWRTKYDNLGKREELQYLYVKWVMRSRD